MNRQEYILYGARVTCKRGNDLPQAKLNPELVKEIRSNRYGKTRKQLAVEYGVHYRTIEKIHCFEIWGQV
jgi:hypothetical protein